MTAEIPPPVTAPPITLLKQYATVLKMLAITLLGLLLLIPLALVNSLLSERLVRRNGAIEEITSTWGSAQALFGPVLLVPFQCTQKVWKEQVVNGRVEKMEVSETVREQAFFLPAAFQAEGRLIPSLLHRGIYQAVVYNGLLTITGSFARPSFADWKVDSQQILWEEAELALSITDLRGAQQSLELKWNDDVIALEPGPRLAGFPGGVVGRIRGLTPQTETLPFELKINLNGSRSLRIAPVGMNNRVHLTSSWPDPSFRGAFLPTERELGPEGFAAHWQVPYYGRSYPQRWVGKNPVATAAVTESLFGVDLVPVIDSYRLVERSIKYGVLVIALLFTAFFLFEVMAGLRIHPFQYALVGIALCLFYLALLALSEVISFGASYWAGAAASTVMISLYSAKALRGGRRAVIVAAGLPVVYGFLFVILRLQDYSLLIGTLGLFLVLALVMYVTRNIDWYARDNS